MSLYSCGQVEELAAELALGTLAGDQRARVLAHAEGCAACRGAIQELSDVADALLLVAPEVSPPAGFERRVSRSMRTARRPSGRLVGVAAVLVLVVAIASGLVAGRLGRADSSVKVQVASFVPQTGEALAGQVFIRADRPAWVFMTVTSPAGAESYSCELVLASGQHVPIGTFQMHNGTGSWGRAVEVKLNDVRSLSLLNAEGRVAATATLPAG